MSGVRSVAESVEVGCAQRAPARAAKPRTKKHAERNKHENYSNRAHKNLYLVLSNLPPHSIGSPG